MATVEMATLCNAATYRSGLMSILEAGVEVFTPGEFPSSAQFVAVLWVRVGADDLGEPAEFVVDVVRQGSDEVVGRYREQIVFPNADDPDFLPHFAAIAPMAVTFTAPAAFTARLSVGDAAAELPIWVRSPQ